MSANISRKVPAKHVTESTRPCGGTATTGGIYTPRAPIAAEQGSLDARGSNAGAGFIGSATL